MRRFAFLLLLSFPFFAADLKIDHITVGGENLDTLRHAFTSMTAIQTEYGGPHSNGATEMATVSFPDGSYLEVIAIQKNASPTALAAHPWATFMNNNAGPCAFAIRAPNMGAIVDHFKNVGIDVSAPQRSGRTRPDGERLDWETTNVGTGHGTFFPFLIRDITPREKRAYPSGKPTTTVIRRVELVVIGVGDLKSAIALYRRAFDLPEPKTKVDSQFGAEVAWFAGTPVVLAQGIDEHSWVTQRVHKYGDAPCAFVFKFAGGIGGGTFQSEWFEHSIWWQNEKILGWRMGREPSGIGD